ncbi:MAG: DUF1801 domain-containing protein [Myxococcales bacterium]|nr:DUF1801 domain-containing protein [Myxococcales bacterium]
MADDELKARPGETVEAFVARLTPERRAVVEAVQAAVAEAAPSAEWILAWRLPWARVGKLKVCYVAPQRAWVNVGLPLGDGLDDPDGLLEGTGKSMRHVKVNSAAEVPHAALVAWIRASL